MKKLSYFENDRLQRVFQQEGPERDRSTRWEDCQEEPWRTFADLVRCP